MGKCFVGRHKSLITEDGQPLFHGIPVLGDGVLVLKALGLALQGMQQNMCTVITLQK